MLYMVWTQWANEPEPCYERKTLIEAIFKGVENMRIEVVRRSIDN